MTSEVATRFPWEPATVEENLTALQRDVAYIVQCTAVKVHSTRPELSMMVNTARGQIVPQGVCRFTDGTSVEFHDIGAPQPGLSYMTVADLVTHVWGVAKSLGLEL